MEHLLLISIMHFWSNGMNAYKHLNLVTWLSTFPSIEILQQTPTKMSNMCDLM